MKRDEKSEVWSGYITPRPPTAPAERMGESKSMSISSLAEKSERERPSEQIKSPIFKWSRQAKDIK